MCLASKWQSLDVSLVGDCPVDHTRLTYRYNGRGFRLTDVYGDVAKKILT